MEKQVKDLFSATMTGWNIEHFVTLRPEVKYRVVATFKGEDFEDRKVFTCEVKRDNNGPYLFIDTF